MNNSNDFLSLEEELFGKSNSLPGSDKGSVDNKNNYISRNSNSYNTYAGTDRNSENSDDKSVDFSNVDVDMNLVTQHVSRSKLSIVTRILLLLFIVSGLIIGVFYVAYTNSNKFDYAIEHPTIIVKPVEEVKKRISDEKLVKQIQETVLKSFEIREFSELLYDNPDNLLGEVRSIEAVNPGTDDGEFSIHFTAQPRIGVWTQQQAYDAAEEIMQIVGPLIPEVTGISAVLSTWDFNNLEPHDYMVERVGREVLSD